MMMDRRGFLLDGMAAVACSSLGISAHAQAEDPRLTAAKRWFKAAQYGMMVHWGVYSLPAGEWKGVRMDPRYLGEWIQHRFLIPNVEYAKLAAAFYPVGFNAEDWVKTAQDAGMKYLVFTSKHHDGFALFRSKVSKFNIVDATPFRRDVVEELAEACRKHGMKLGLYYSQDLDWSDPDGGGYTVKANWRGPEGCWTNFWDYPDHSNKDFSRYFEAKAKPQVKEILTQYGDLCLIWFDIGETLTARQSNELYDMVRRFQPACLINSRIGCGTCDYTSAGDNVIPTDDKSGMLFESPCTLNDTWGYVAHDQNWKSAAKIRATREHLKAIGANYLLNVGPDHLGRIPAPSVDILREARS